MKHMPEYQPASRGSHHLRELPAAAVAAVYQTSRKRRWRPLAGSERSDVDTLVQRAFRGAGGRLPAAVLGRCSRPAAVHGTRKHTHTERPVYLRLSTHAPHRRAARTRAGPQAPARPRQGRAPPSTPPHTITELPVSETDTQTLSLPPTPSPGHGRPVRQTAGVSATQPSSLQRASGTTRTHKHTHASIEMLK